MTYSDDKHIDYIIDHFDFERVRKFMIADNWMWGFLPRNRVPTLSELKSTALNLLMEIKDMEMGCYISTGGFTAFKNDDSLELYFSIEEKDSEMLNLNKNYKKDKTLKDRKEKLEKIHEISS